jgi:hypothetical protein
MQKFRVGQVTSLSPLRVLAEGWCFSRRWDEVEKFQVVQAYLTGFRNTELRKHAVFLGATKEELDTAFDQKDVNAAFMELVIKKVSALGVLKGESTTREEPRSPSFAPLSRAKQDHQVAAMPHDAKASEAGAQTQKQGG